MSQPIQSVPFVLSSHVVNSLRALEQVDFIVRDNPVTRAALEMGDRVIFVEDTDDEPTTKEGQAEGRTFRFNVGVINRTNNSREQADRDMQTIKPMVVSALMAACRGLQADNAIKTFQAPREGRRSYRIEGIDVGGALILTRYEIDYRTPAARG
jgi:hypothetical protein